MLNIIEFRSRKIATLKSKVKVVAHIIFCDIHQFLASNVSWGKSLGIYDTLMKSITNTIII